LEFDQLILIVISGLNHLWNMHLVTASCIC